MVSLCSFTPARLRVTRSVIRYASLPRGCRARHADCCPFRLANTRATLRFPPEKAVSLDTRHGRDSTAKQTNGSEHADSIGKATHGRGSQKTTLTKEELQTLLFQNIGLSKRECREIVNTIFEEIRVALESGESVKLEGFGRFQPKERPRRWARNLRSGEKIAISERRVVTFHASRKLTDSIQQDPPARVRR